MKDKQEILNTYIKTNVVPIVIDFLESKYIPNSIVLNPKKEKIEIDGHYEGIEYKPPKGLEILLNDPTKLILVIDDLEKIPTKDQNKFIEILKYRQISTFEIPEEYRIIIIIVYITPTNSTRKIWSRMSMGCAYNYIFIINSCFFTYLLSKWILKIGINTADAYTNH